MSRWTHAKPSTNSRRNQPPAIDPAPRPPEFFTSAMSDFRSSRYSSHSGNGQHRSPARSPASRTSASSVSSFPIWPIATCPSATTTAPVSVAASITAAGLKRRAYESASHRMSRPSASVLMISMVLPRWLLTTSPGFTAVPDGRFSVAGIRPTTFTFGLSTPRTSNAPSTAAAPDMSYFMSSMLCAGLIEMPPESNVTPLPISAIGAASAALPAPLVLEHDEPRLLLCTLRHREQCPHAFGLHRRAVQHRDAEAVLLGQLAGLVREVSRRTHIAGLHLQIAGQPVAGGDRVADAPPRLRLFGFRGRHHHRDRLDVGFRIVVRPFQLGERPRPLPCPLDRHLPHIAGAHPVPRFGRHRQMKPRRPQRPGAAGGHPGGAPHPLAAYLTCLSHPPRHEPL